MSQTSLAFSLEEPSPLPLATTIAGMREAAKFLYILEKSIVINNDNL